MRLPIEISPKKVQPSIKDLETFLKSRIDLVNEGLLSEKSVDEIFNEVKQKKCMQ